MDDSPRGGEEGGTIEDAQEEEDGGPAEGSNKVGLPLVGALRDEQEGGGASRNCTHLAEWPGQGGGWHPSNSVRCLLER